MRECRGGSRPKIHSKTSKRTPLAQTGRRKGHLSHRKDPGREGEGKQNRISWPRTPVNMPKRVPKRAQESIPRRLQTLQVAANLLSRGVLELSNHDNLIFEGCTVQNHKFWKCRGAPRRPQERPKMLSEPRWASLGDDKKWTPKPDQVKNRFLRRKHWEIFQVSSPGPGKWDPKYI